MDLKWLAAETGDDAWLQMSDVLVIGRSKICVFLGFQKAPHMSISLTTFNSVKACVCVQMAVMSSRPSVACRQYGRSFVASKPIYMETSTE